MTDIKTSKHNWLHLDLKGAVPSARKMQEQLHFFQKCGYTGIVWEYDDRIPWKSWQGTWRKGYTMEEQQLLIRTCKDLNLEVIPLIQIQGHLEWLLKHEAYHELRENGVGSEICPLHPDTVPLLEGWINEVIALHPESRFIHLGGDETWYAGTCERCRQHDKMDIYINHVSKMCRYTLERGVRPLIWADMFWRENRMDIAAQLPDGTILVDWQYKQPPPYDSTAELLKSGLEVMGASGIMIGWWEHCLQIMSEPQSRIENVSAWNRYAQDNELGVIHTTWTRGASLWHIYGTWFGAIPAFIAGGDPEAWEMHPWCNFIRKLSRVMERNQVDELNKIAEDILQIPVSSAMEIQARRWMNLAVRYQALQQELQIHRSTRRTLEQVSRFVGREEFMFRKNAEEPFHALLPKLDLWEQEARLFWQDNELSDEEEFMATHICLIRTDAINY